MEPKPGKTSVEVNRRKLIVLTATGTALWLARRGITVDSDFRHHENTFQLYPRNPENPQLTENVSHSDRIQPREYVTTKGQIVIDNSLYLLQEPMRIRAGHRYGNSDEWIQRAVRRGIRGIDIDANHVKSLLMEETYAEHGLASVKIRGLHVPLPFVYDRDAKKVHIGPAKTKYEQVFQEIARANKSIKDPSRHLIALTEAKRGDFTPYVLTKIYDIHHKYDIAGVVFGKDPEWLKIDQADH